MPLSQWQTWIYNVMLAEGRLEKVMKSPCKILVFNRLLILNMTILNSYVRPHRSLIPITAELAVSRVTIVSAEGTVVSTCYFFTLR